MAAPPLTKRPPLYDQAAKTIIRIAGKDKATSDIRILVLFWHVMNLAHQTLALMTKLYIFVYFYMQL